MQSFLGDALALLFLDAIALGHDPAVLALAAIARLVELALEIVAPIFTFTSVTSEVSPA